ncbi:MICOS complex subunit MIC13 homolog QIL1 [Gryllus bimaculatus]|nr:MICOS complex subunit MIC13 homolog QIL1 [Gryllus bimaculatus]
MAFRFLRFGIKAGLCGAFVHYTIEEGVWGNSEDSAKLYADLYKNVAPYIKEVPVEVPELPKVENITHASQHYWNQGVKITFTFLKDLPTHTIHWSKKGWEIMQKFAESPKAVSDKSD